MVNREMIGKALSTFTYEVDRSKIRELALAVGDPNPIYQDVAAARAAGYPDLPAPPTFGTVLSFWGNRRGFITFRELNITQPNLVLHGEEEYNYLAPIYAGDTITGTLTMTGVDEKQGRTGSLEFVTFEFDYINQNGAAVLKTRQTAVIRQEVAK